MANSCKTNSTETTLLQTRTFSTDCWSASRGREGGKEEKEEEEEEEKEEKRRRKRGKSRTIV